MTEAAKVVTAPELEGAAPATVEVTLGDKTLKVDSATAEAVKAFQKAVVDAGVATKAQIDQLSAQVRELTPKKTPTGEPATPDYDSLIFTDPKKAVQLIKDEIRSELNGQLASTKAQNDFWTEFYRQNEDLKDADWLVKSVLTREMGNLKDLKVPEAIKQLAETVKADILKLSGKKPRKEAATEIEGSNERRPKPSNEAETESESSPSSITDVLKARRAARRAGPRAAA